MPLSIARRPRPADEKAENRPPPSRKLKRILDLDDFDRAVRRRLPHAIYDYVARGSESETTLRANREAQDDWRLLPRVLVGVKQRSAAISLFGQTYAQPFGIAPMGGSALVAFDGHNAMAKAAVSANIPFILSANSIVPMEEVGAAYPGAWFAAYQSPNERAIEGMVKRVAKAAFGVFVLTSDVPVGSNREADARNGFSFPIRPGLKLSFDVATHPTWLVGVLGRTFLKRGVPHLINLEPDGGPNLFSRSVAHIASHESLNWDHVRLIRKFWKGPLVIKGLLSPGDVTMARECGADGVIVSNHGGRQLDQAVASLRVLPEMAEQAKGLTLMIDSGFRRGTDVLKALALGAQCVFVGRPFLYAAAYAGEAGVHHAISLLAREIDKDMALLGRRNIGEISRDMVTEAKK
jgi:L-lactate dehydrogenase (cytochrome)